MKKNVFEIYNMYKTKGANNDNLSFIKPNTSWMSYYYKNKSITFFNKPNYNIKFIDNDEKFKFNTFL